MNRRMFIATTMMGLPLALTLGLLRPTRVLAAWPTDAFFATALEEAVTSLFGDNPLTADASVEIEAPDIAENGASVPVTVRSRLSGTRSITLLSEKNPNPAVARFQISPRVEAFVNTRIRMGASGDLIAVAEADGRYYLARRAVKVTTGGCAG